MKRQENEQSKSGENLEVAETAKSQPWWLERQVEGKEKKRKRKRRRRRRRRVKLRDEEGEGRTRELQ